jgi:hypothetical protein
MLTERGELHVRKGIIFMDWLPPIEVSRISYGGKVRPHKELSDPHSVRFFSKIWFYPFPFSLDFITPDPKLGIFLFSDCSDCPYTTGKTLTRSTGPRYKTETIRMIEESTAAPALTTLKREHGARPGKA